MHDGPARPPLSSLDEIAALCSIVGTATHTGARFFTTLVESLARALNTHGAWVTISSARHRRHTVRGRGREPPARAHPDNVLDLYPGDKPGIAAGAVSYMGVPLLDVDGTVLGHLAVRAPSQSGDVPGVGALTVSRCRQAERQRPAAAVPLK